MEIKTLQIENQNQRNVILKILEDDNPTTYCSMEDGDNENILIDGNVSFSAMAEIVDYLRFPNWKNCEQEIAKSEEYNRLLDENRKLFNEWEKLKKENETLKEKTKHLPRIATLNKRIHELQQEKEKLERQLSKKDYKE